mgnify:CR=1 FL=1
MRITELEATVAALFQSLFSWNLLLMLIVLVAYWYLMQFQSLFSWNLLLMAARPEFIWEWSWCFNPCFRGTCSWCPPARPRLPASWVSILVFVELALDEARTPCQPQRRQVSILVFVELALDGPKERGPQEAGTVSILVFVELALDDRYCRSLFPSEIDVSILVFVELALDVY